MKASLIIAASLLILTFTVNAQIINTFAGNGDGFAADGDNGPATDATLPAPYGIAKMLLEIFM